jgi:SAM-dependent methyltransferase
LTVRTLIRRLKRLSLAAAPAHANVPQDAPGFIDVRALIERLDDQSLMRGADAYFARIGAASEQCRKPWGNPTDAVHQTRHLGLVLEAADLFRGCRVLDFGCATGWLTMGLAQSGCNAVGVDIAPNALRLAEQLKAQRPPALGGGTLDFLAYDGHQLPLPEASLDRIVCFDAFHHVRDQQATIREFARVLRPGGRAAFIEPGPDHSKTPQSQAEMARFAVIENDVDMAAIARFAVEAGFDKPRMLVQFQQPVTVEVDDFLAWAGDGLPKRWSTRAMDTLQRQLTDGQCFFIVRQGQDAAMPDSRRPEGLAAEIEILRAAYIAPARGRGIELAVRVRNTGSVRWLTASGSGQVNLGVQVQDAQGRLVDDNFGRLKLPPSAGAALAPGEEATLKATIQLPGTEHFTLRLDMVAELVAWFSRCGASQPALLRAADISPAG